MEYNTAYSSLAFEYLSTLSLKSKSTSRLQIMASSVSSESNLAGAVISIIYVVSALFFTGIVIGILLYSPESTHRSLSSSSTKKHQRSSHENKVQTFRALSKLSFAVLSYHMMSFLIYSYKAWALEQGIELPQKFLGHDGLIDIQHGTTRICVWEWLTSSTLFRDFAEIICGSSARYWWTQQANRVQWLGVSS